jgi:hypothetical protein
MLSQQYIPLDFMFISPIHFYLLSFLYLSEFTIIPSKKQNTCVILFFCFLLEKKNFFTSFGSPLFLKNAFLQKNYCNKKNYLLFFVYLFFYNSCNTNSGYIITFLYLKLYIFAFKMSDPLFFYRRELCHLRSLSNATTGDN